MSRLWQRGLQQKPCRVCDDDHKGSGHEAARDEFQGIRIVLPDARRARLVKGPFRQGFTPGRTNRIHNAHASQAFQAARPNGGRRPRPGGRFPARPRPARTRRRRPRSLARAQGPSFSHVHVGAPRRMPRRAASEDHGRSWRACSHLAPAEGLAAYGTMSIPHVILRVRHRPTSSSAISARPSVRLTTTRRSTVALPTASGRPSPGASSHPARPCLGSASLRSACRCRG